MIMLMFSSLLKYRLKKGSRLLMRGGHLTEARQFTKALTDRSLAFQVTY